MSSTNNTERTGSTTQAAERISKAADRVRDIDHDHDAALGFMHLAEWLGFQVEHGITPTADQLAQAVENAVQAAAGHEAGAGRGRQIRVVGGDPVLAGRSVEGSDRAATAPPAPSRRGAEPLAAVTAASWSRSIRITVAGEWCSPLRTFGEDQPRGDLPQDQRLRGLLNEYQPAA